MTITKPSPLATSDDAVFARTGKHWKQWFTILDRWDALTKGHKATAKHLHDKHGLTAWWSQEVTIRYEQARGLRQIGQRADGAYQLSVQRTVAATLTDAYEACTDPRILSRWFSRKSRADLRVGGRYRNADGDTGEFLALTPPHRIRFTWDNADHCPGTVVEITLSSSGRGKTAVRVTHMKLKSAADREEMKEGWTWALDSLKSYLETGKPIPHEEWKKKARTH